MRSQDSEICVIAYILINQHGKLDQLHDIVSKRGGWLHPLHPAPCQPRTPQQCCEYENIGQGAGCQNCPESWQYLSTAARKVWFEHALKDARDLAPLSRLLWIILRDPIDLFRWNHRSNAFSDSSFWRSSQIYQQQKGQHITCQDAAQKHSSP